MTVLELKKEEINELKSRVFFMMFEDLIPYIECLDYNTQELIYNTIVNAETPEEIPNDIIYLIFEGFDFVEEDFFINL